MYYLISILRAHEGACQVDRVAAHSKRNLGRPNDVREDIVEHGVGNRIASRKFKWALTALP